MNCMTTTCIRGEQRAANTIDNQRAHLTAITDNILGVMFTFGRLIFMSELEFRKHSVTIIHI